ncbi:hypothetical protein ACPZRF_09035, partial [Alkalicoccus sp. WONF2802]
MTEINIYEIYSLLIEKTVLKNEHEITSTTYGRGFGQQFPIWRSKRVWGMLGEDVGSRADFCSSAIAELHGCNECRKC